MRSAGSTLSTWFPNRLKSAARCWGMVPVPRCFSQTRRPTGSRECCPDLRRPVPGANASGESGIGMADDKRSCTNASAGRGQAFQSDSRRAEPAFLPHRRHRAAGRGGIPQCQHSHRAESVEVDIERDRSPFTGPVDDTRHTNGLAPASRPRLNRCEAYNFTTDCDIDFLLKRPGRRPSHQGGRRRQTDETQKIRASQRAVITKEMRE